MSSPSLTIEWIPMKISKAFFWKCCTGRFVLATLCFVLANPYKFSASTPKQIRELMKFDGLTNDEVKSHLQVCICDYPSVLNHNLVDVNMTEIGSYFACD
ncbi:hypothetical protein DVH24_012138 [Malus domestica]|uniref:HTH myb-type domain-containing protein n=1 Tax=Malus domestica TaxID=3750 RepID=A0A498HQ81_MALDO|nr:hypothetical protein DVH24_012138 [Malus domestica]